MSTLEVKVESRIRNVSVNSHSIHVILADGREVSVPIEWFPRLRDANSAQRNNWRLIGGGIGIHWEDIDEDISVKSMLTV